MVKESGDCPVKGSVRRIAFDYDVNNPADCELLKRMSELIHNSQKECPKCVHFYEEGGFGGYMACLCEIHGCLEVCGNPHHDMDGSKCKDYSERGVANEIHS